MVISDSKQLSSRKQASSLTNRDETGSYLQASKYNPGVTNSNGNPQKAKNHDSEVQGKEKAANGGK